MLCLENSGWKFYIQFQNGNLLLRLIKSRGAAMRVSQTVFWQAQLYPRSMHIKNGFFICLLIITGCQQKQEGNIKLSRVDSLKNSLIGKWRGLNESRPVFKITRDSIYSYAHNK